MEPLEQAQGILDDVTERVLAEVPAGAVLFDAHTHLGDDIDGMLGRPDELLAIFDRVGIERTFSFCLDEPDRVPAFTAANDRTLAYAAANPDRIIPFVRLDLAESPIEEARRCLDLGARGIKLHPRAQKFSVGDERLDAVFALAVEREVPILIHGGRGLPPIGDHLAALVERYAGVRLIIAHAGIADLGGLAGHFAYVPGVFFDTSVWSIVDLLDLMRQVAPEQILFATDYPYGRLPNSLLLTLRAAKLSDFDEDDLRRLLGRHGTGDRGRCSAAGAVTGEGAGGDHAPAAAGAHPRLHRDGDAAALDAPAGRGRRPRPRAERRPRGERRRRARRRPDPLGAHRRIGAVGRDRGDRGPAGVRADRAGGPPARPHRGHPRRDDGR